MMQLSPRNLTDSLWETSYRALILRPNIHRMKGRDDPPARVTELTSEILLFSQKKIKITKNIK